MIILLCWISVSNTGLCFADGEDSDKAVFLNQKGISAKSTSGKSMNAMPDVCQSPAVDSVSIPYANTASASESAKGSKKVKVEDSQPLIKDESFQPSLFEEEGAANDDLEYETLKKVEEIRKK